LGGPILRIDDIFHPLGVEQVVLRIVQRQAMHSGEIEDGPDGDLRPLLGTFQLERLDMETDSTTARQTLTTVKATASWRRKPAGINALDKALTGKNIRRGSPPGYDRSDSCYETPPRKREIGFVIVWMQDPKAHGESPGVFRDTNRDPSIRQGERPIPPGIGHCQKGGD